MSADLRRLREWLTFDQATHDLTRRSGQRMGWPELLRLALDGHAALCVSLPPVEVHAPGAGESHFIVSGSRPRPRSIEGVWDLPAEGLARQHLHQLLRDNTGGTGPLMAEIRTGLVVERGTTRWEIPQRVWPDHTTTGRALAVRWAVLDALVVTQHGLDTRADAREAALSPAPPRACRRGMGEDGQGPADPHQRISPDSERKRSLKGPRPDSPESWREIVEGERKGDLGSGRPCHAGCTTRDAWPVRRALSLRGWAAPA